MGMGPSPAAAPDWPPEAVWAGVPREELASWPPVPGYKPRLPLQEGGNPFALQAFRNNKVHLGLVGDGVQKCRQRDILDPNYDSTFQGVGGRLRSSLARGAGAHLHLLGRTTLCAAAGRLFFKAG